jgi:hypothetical protein
MAEKETFVCIERKRGPMVIMERTTRGALIATPPDTGHLGVEIPFYVLGFQICASSVEVLL